MTLMAIDDAADQAAEGATSRRAARRPARNGTAGGGAVYGLGMIGAAVYFFRAAGSREDYLLAVPKAIFWPALLVYGALKRIYG